MFKPSAQCFTGQVGHHRSSAFQGSTGLLQNTGPVQLLLLQKWGGGGGLSQVPSAHLFFSIPPKSVPSLTFLHLA